VTEFPMTASGKIQKFIVRQQMGCELGLNGEASEMAEGVRS
jgi:acyl-coenzyme A synthetase/AMP-(fatty) acid ligase